MIELDLRREVPVTITRQKILACREWQQALPCDSRNSPDLPFDFDGQLRREVAGARRP